MSVIRTSVIVAGLAAGADGAGAAAAGIVLGAAVTVAPAAGDAGAAGLPVLAGPGAVLGALQAASSAAPSARPSVTRELRRVRIERFMVSPARTATSTGADSVKKAGVADLGAVLR